MAWGHKIFGGEPLADLSDPVLVVIFMILTVVGGAYLGHSWFKDGGTFDLNSRDDG